MVTTTRRVTAAAFDFVKPEQTWPSAPANEPIGAGLPADVFREMLDRMATTSDVGALVKLHEMAVETHLDRESLLQIAALALVCADKLAK